MPRGYAHKGLAGYGSEHHHQMPTGLWDSHASPTLCSFPRITSWSRTGGRIRTNAKEKKDLTVAHTPAFCRQAGVPECAPGSAAVQAHSPGPGGSHVWDQRNGRQGSICLRTERLTGGMFAPQGPGPSPCGLTGQSPFPLLGLRGDAVSGLCRPPDSGSPVGGDGAQIQTGHCPQWGLGEASSLSDNGVKYKPVPTDPQETLRVQTYGSP